MRIEALLAIGVLWSSRLIALDVAAGDPPAARPNVVIYITDDESWRERSVYGWSTLPTPSFDRVAREGALFKHGYTSAPSCAPSRASLLTGRNFWELEEGAFIQAWLPSKFPVLPDLLEAGGYHAGYTGKGWGPGLVTQGGRTRNPAGTPFNRIKRTHAEDGISDIDYAANFSAFLAARPDDKPFFFWVGCIEPHTPLGPQNHQKLAEQYGVGPDAIKVPGFLPDTPGVRRHRADILYEICHADEDLGRILKILEDRGALENTLLIVTSDNGTQIPRSKANVYDWGVRVPLAMMWPARIKPHRHIDDFVNFIDLAPTVLDAARLPIPGGMSGRSFLTTLFAGASGQVDPSRTWTAAGLEWHGEQSPASRAARMIRDGQYQYIVNYGMGSIYGNPAAKKRRPDAEYEHTAQTADAVRLLEVHPEHPAVARFVPLFQAHRPREELYDCETDPWQLHNLADSAAHADVKARLRALLEAYQRQTKDPRITGDMALFERTRAFVERRKKKGYKD
ncbi:MAG TPA: sulfatase [Opitutaceae bacterium]